MNLTPENIILIIKECKGHVKSIKIKGSSIEVEFLGPHQPQETTPSTHNQGLPNDPVTSEEVPDNKNLLKDLSEGVDQDEIDNRELIDELNITDPSRMEELIALKEIVDET